MKEYAPLIVQPSTRLNTALQVTSNSPASDEVAKDLTLDVLNPNPPYK